MQTSAPATLAADSVYRLGYIGHKRYVRLSLTKFFTIVVIVLSLEGIVLDRKSVV